MTVKYSIALLLMLISIPSSFAQDTNPVELRDLAILAFGISIFLTLTCFLTIILGSVVIWLIRKIPTKHTHPDT